MKCHALDARRERRWRDITHENHRFGDAKRLTSRGMGAAIADASGVEHSLPAHKVDVVHTAEPDEWCVTVNGERVLSFSGPSAWTHALSHQAELNDLLVGSSSDTRGEEHP